MKSSGSCGRCEPPSPTLCPLSQAACLTAHESITQTLIELNCGSVYPAPISLNHDLSALTTRRLKQRAVHRAASMAAKACSGRLSLDSASRPSSVEAGQPSGSSSRIRSELRTSEAPSLWPQQMRSCANIDSRWCIRFTVPCRMKARGQHGIVRIHHNCCCIPG